MTVLEQPTTDLRTEIDATDRSAAELRTGPRTRLGVGLAIGLRGAVLYLLLASGWWLLASFLWSMGHRAGVVVADAASWHHSFQTLSREYLANFPRPTGFFLALYDLNPHLNTLFNAILLSIAVVIGGVAGAAAGGRRGAWFVVALLAVNPWVWVITLGPTKEPAAIAAAVACTLAILVPRWSTTMLALLSVAALAPFRLEQAVMLAIALAAAPLLRMVRQPRLLLLAGSALALAAAVSLFELGPRLLGDTFYQLSPQLWPLAAEKVGPSIGTLGEFGRALGERGWYDPVWNAAAVAYRLAAGPAGCLLRMGVVTDTGLPSVLGIGQAITGLVVAAGFVALALRLWRRSDRDATLLAAPVLILWIGAAAVAFVQPRYIFVLLPIAAVLLAGLTPGTRLRVMAACVVLGLAGRVALAALGFGIPADRAPETLSPRFLLLPSEPALELAPMQASAPTDSTPWPT